jgi:hypothetical protein
MGLGSFRGYLDWHHARRPGFSVKIGKDQAGEHEDHGRGGSHPAHEAFATSGTEDGLACAGAERSADLGPLACLEQNNDYQGDADQNMKDNQSCNHLISDSLTSFFSNLRNLSQIELTEKGKKVGMNLPFN